MTAGVPPSERGELARSSQQPDQALDEPQTMASDKGGDGREDTGPSPVHVWPELSTARQVLLTVSMTLCMMLNVRPAFP